MDFLGPIPDLYGAGTSSSRSRWWVYPAITIPLTVLVFVVWKCWMIYRTRCNVEMGITPDYSDIAAKQTKPQRTILSRLLTVVNPWPASQLEGDIEAAGRAESGQNYVSQHAVYFQAQVNDALTMQHGSLAVSRDTAETYNAVAGPIAFQGIDIEMGSSHEPLAALRAQLSDDQSGPPYPTGSYRHARHSGPFLSASNSRSITDTLHSRTLPRVPLHISQLMLSESSRCTSLRKD